MSREIKFRGKCIDNGEWVYGHYFISPLTDENSGASPDKGWFFLSGEKRHCIERDHVVFIVDPGTVEQFTGMHDKNGKEIYEGDIVLIREGIAVITFYCGSFWCSFWTLLLLSDRGVEVEVIGNIYENPELIK